MYVRKYILSVSVLTIPITVFLRNICSADPGEVSGLKDIRFTRKCTGKIVLVCEDKSTAKPFGELLSAAGFTVEVMSKKEKVLEVPTSEADLVILTPMSRSTWGPLQWKRVQFERSQGKKILAMGDSGADFLGAGELLIGHPHVWHDPRLPKIVCILTSLQDTPFRTLLGNHALSQRSLTEMAVLW